MLPGQMSCWLVIEYVVGGGGGGYKVILGWGFDNNEQDLLIHWNSLLTLNYNLQWFDQSREPLGIQIPCSVIFLSFLWINMRLC